MRQKGLVYQNAHRLFSTCIGCTRGRVVLTRKLCDIFYLHEFDGDLGTLALSYHELEHLRRRFHRVDLSGCIFPESPEKLKFIRFLFNPDSGQVSFCECNIFLHSEMRLLTVWMTMLTYHWRCNCDWSGQRSWRSLELINKETSILVPRCCHRWRCYRLRPG